MRQMGNYREEGGGISLVMMECTVAFCTFPPSTSHLRWLKRPNDEYLGVNPPPLLLSVFSTADVFPLTHTKGFCFCYQACPFLKGQRSSWSQGEAVTASLNIWRPSERDENSIPAKKKKGYTDASRLLLSKDLLSICWCSWKHTV